MAYPIQISCPWPQVDPEDARILSDVLNGNREAYGVVVEKYWDRIYQRVYSLLHNHEDAEEITQDAFTRAMTSLDRFRGEAAFSTWLFQIASNLARNRYWYWRRRKKDASISLSAPVHEGLQVGDFLPSEDPDPRHTVEFEEVQRRIEHAIPKLPRLHRQILEFRLYENLSYEEIAHRLELPLGTVKSRINRAREALSGLLD